MVKKSELKQMRRQRACKREANKEKKVVSLYREKSRLENFNFNREAEELYQNTDPDEVEKLSLDQRRLYQMCEKAKMFENYQELKEMDRKLKILKESLYYDELNDEDYYCTEMQYNDLKQSYKDRRHILTRDSHSRRLFRRCQDLDGLEENI